MADSSGRKSSRLNEWSRRAFSRKGGFIITGIVLFGLLFRFLGDRLYDYDPISTVEAAAKPALIVVLTGGKKRIEAAFQLFTLSNSTTLFIAGAGPHTSLYSLMRTNLSTEDTAALEKRMDSIVVEKESRNTIENAYAVENFLNRNPEFKEIILITSSYHLRRSLLIFRHIISPSLKIYAYSPPNSPISRDNWFYSVKGIETTGMELIKLLFAGLVIPQLSNF